MLPERRRDKPAVYHGRLHTGKQAEDHAAAPAWRPVHWFWLVIGVVAALVWVWRQP
jgi:hypothetical protein